jgi:hypothetical protein
MPEVGAHGALVESDAIGEAYVDLGDTPGV